MKTTTILLFAVSLLCVACSDNRGATDTNFTEALGTYYKGTPECVSPKIRFPFEVEKGKNPRTSKQLLLAWFEAAGFVEADKDVELTIVKHPSAIESIFYRKAKTRRYKTTGTRWSLTQEGEQALEDGDLCYGTREIVSVDKIEPPRTVFGKTMSKAQYSFEIVDMPKWARIKEAAHFSRSIAIAQTSSMNTLKAQQLMELTPDGWLVVGRTRAKYF
jgi:hypothetical protein